MRQYLLIAIIIVMKLSLGYGFHVPFFNKQRVQVKFGNSNLLGNPCHTKAMHRLCAIVTLDTSVGDGSEEEDEEEDLTVGAEVEEETEEELDLALEEVSMTDDEDEDEDEEINLEQEMTWKRRRELRKVTPAVVTKEGEVPKKLTWEEKYDEDPLRSEEPTTELEPEKLPFQNHYIAMAFVEGDEQMASRAAQWTPHMQWSRRSALVPELYSGMVEWEHTLLSPDCMKPVGQMLGINADSEEGARELLASEPLVGSGGVSDWQLYRAHWNDGDNVTWAMSESQVFIGTLQEDDATQNRFNTLLHQSLDYHGQHPHRVSMFARLTAAGADDPPTDLVDHSLTDTAGVLMVFNAKTNADALRYVHDEPIVASGLLDQWMVVPINVQDIDGRHHLMPRTFGEKVMLDKLHYMDPEDLFFEDHGAGMPEDTASLNRQVLDFLKAAGKSYRYDRLDLETRFRGDVSEKEEEDFNTLMERAAKLRLQPVVEEPAKET